MRAGEAGHRSRGPGGPVGSAACTQPRPERDSYKQTISRYLTSVATSVSHTITRWSSDTVTNLRAMGGGEGEEEKREGVREKGRGK